MRSYLISDSTLYTAIGCEVVEYQLIKKWTVQCLLKKASSTAEQHHKSDELMPKLYNALSMIDDNDACEVLKLHSI